MNSISVDNSYPLSTCLMLVVDKYGNKSLCKVGNGCQTRCASTGVTRNQFYEEENVVGNLILKPKIVNPRGCIVNIKQTDQSQYDIVGYYNPCVSNGLFGLDN